MVSYLLKQLLLHAQILIIQRLLLLIVLSLLLGAPLLHQVQCTELDLLHLSERGLLVIVGVEGHRVQAWVLLVLTTYQVYSLVYSIKTIPGTCGQISGQNLLPECLSLTCSLWNLITRIRDYTINTSFLFRGSLFKFAIETVDDGSEDYSHNDLIIVSECLSDDIFISS
jgi:hypothetical protein